MRDEPLRFDYFGRASLDGVWDFYPGEHELDDLGALSPEQIRVPALWEAQGHLELDGVAWYRRPFHLDRVPSFASVRFGAVMDIADVYVNGAHVGSHDAPFTPFSFDVASHLREGENVLAVRVFDPPVDHPEHIRMAHGKQGWANWVFPSRPSLYMTYGGIWQPVELRAHGPLVIDDIFVNSDPDDLVVTVELRNVSDEPMRGRLSVRTLGFIAEFDVDVQPRAVDTITAKLGATEAPLWSPEEPILHDVLVDVVSDGRPSEVRTSRFGLRTIRLEGTRMFINNEPFRMKSVLVQGFRADGLYDEGTREEIEAEVRTAREMGFNMLRLHIKAFDPRYLDICDELGMLLHCDIPVAEPIAHEEMGYDNDLTRRSVEAAIEQVKRDRNHPSIVLWSAMNELCYDRQEARRWDEYERFVRAVAGAVVANDPTRPTIENDWAEPDPDRVFLSPILTAHWYGRLHADYLEKIERACRKWQDVGMPLYITEFGDWGLPEMPHLSDAPFWDTREIYAAGLAATLWPATVERFVRETQRYQGLSDRLQIEVFRRHDHIGGYCLTELTDVPHELNGLLDLLRRPKPIAIREIARANQTVLPMLQLDSLVLEAGSTVRVPVHIANDGEAIDDVTIEVQFGEATHHANFERLLASDASDLPFAQVAARFDEESWAAAVGRLAAHRPLAFGDAVLVAPQVTGAHDVLVRLSSKGRVVSTNRYPIHVVARPEPLGPVRVLGDMKLARRMEELGGIVGDAGPVILGEGSLDDDVAKRVLTELDAGASVIVLAQSPEAAHAYPGAVRIVTVETAWGSSVFHFTTDHGALSSLPRRNVLVAEDSTIQATAVIAEVDGAPFPTQPFVIAYKPTPGAMTGTVVGEHRVGRGRLIFCQYRLLEPARRGDAAARALLADLVSWAREPRPSLRAEVLTKDDGRTLTLYSFEGSP